MEIINTIEDMKQLSRIIRAGGKTIGLAPTMGCLHEGHLSLVRKSLTTCDFTVVSIFINPAQFGENEDLDTYPKDFEGDLRKLEQLGVQAVFLPSREELYPPDYKTYVHVEEITIHLCGKTRPAYFRGMGTIVLKLFMIVQPHTAFFGQKDWQQLVVVETMVRDLNLDVSIVSLPIVRETDGLAMSSRNLYLSQEDRKSALALSRALETAKTLVQKGESSGDKIRSEMRSIITQHPHTNIDYASVYDPQNFVEQDTINGRVLIALAVRVGTTRLIDNCIVEKN